VSSAALPFDDRLEGTDVKSPEATADTGGDPGTDATGSGIALVMSRRW